MGKTKSDMNWTTPTQMDSADMKPDLRPSRIATGRTTDYLARQVNWQTPEAKNNKSYHNQKDGSRIEKLGTQAGAGKLNPDWVEQLMGLPVGWTQLSGVTDPHENRIDRLRLLGNGVVSQTAEKAFRTLLEGLCT